MSTQARPAVSFAHLCRLSNRARNPPCILQHQSEKRKGEYESCTRQCHVDHAKTRAMSNDSSYHQGGSEQKHTKLSQTKLLNPLERWKTLGTDWMGVICELEGVVLSDLSPSHRAAWRNLAYEENLQCPREYDVRHYQNLKADVFLDLTLNVSETFTHDLKVMGQLSWLTDAQQLFQKTISKQFFVRIRRSGKAWGFACPIHSVIPWVNGG